MVCVFQNNNKGSFERYHPHSLNTPELGHQAEAAVHTGAFGYNMSRTRNERKNTVGHSVNSAVRIRTKIQILQNEINSLFIPNSVFIHILLKIP